MTPERILLGIQRYTTRFLVLRCPHQSTLDHRLPEEPTPGIALAWSPQNERTSFTQTNPRRAGCSLHSKPRSWPGHRSSWESPSPLWNCPSVVRPQFPVSPSCQEDISNLSSGLPGSPCKLRVRKEDFGGSDSKESTCNTGDPGSIPGSGRTPGEGNGNPLQYSCLRTPWTEEPSRQESTGPQRDRHD